MKLIDVVALRKEMYRKSFEVDAVPVRHGKWIQDEFGTPWGSPYCPICGAKMERKE